MVNQSSARTVLLPVRRAVGKVARRLGLRRSQRARPTAVRSAQNGPASAPTSASRVDLVDGREISGVLVVPPGSSPVRLRLLVNDLEVDRVDVPASEGPSSFRFAVRDMWRYCGPQDHVTVRTASNVLPMPGGNLSFSPRHEAKLPLVDLKARLEAGELIDSQGHLAVPKYLDEAWQQSATKLYRDIHEAVRELTGYQSFLVYGSLLGAVREGRPLGHDLDFDTAYLSVHTDPEQVVAEAGDIALALQERGFSVEARATCIHVADADRTQRIDLYHFFFNESGELRLAWGAASDVPFRRDQWDGLEEIEFAGARVLVPRCAEDLVAHFYGPNWRVPNPGFNWQRERKVRAREAAFPVALRPVINWQDYWLYTSFDAPSSFAYLIESLNLRPGLVVDLGCGDGRDVPRFVRSGARVLALDYTPAAVASARQRGLAPEHATFQRCDLSSPDVLRSVVTSTPEPRPKTLFYGRQLLDSVSDDTRNTILSELETLARPGDAVAFEFRDLTDDTLHYHERLSCGRRLVDPALIRDWLNEAGFEAIVDHGSPKWEKKGSKQIHLHRVVATRQAR